MLPEAYFSLFLVGLVGGGHCIGMCGGIVSALSMNSRAQPFLHLAYNAGRLFSYSTFYTVLNQETLIRVE